LIQSYLDASKPENNGKNMFTSILDFLQKSINKEVIFNATGVDLSEEEYQ